MKTLLKSAFFALITLVGTNNMVCPAPSVRAHLALPKDFAKETLVRLVLVHDFLTKTVENDNVAKYFTANENALATASNALQKRLNDARVYAAKAGKCKLGNIRLKGIWDVYFIEAAEVVHQFMIAITQGLEENTFDAATKADLAQYLALIKPWDATPEIQDPLLSEVVQFLLNENTVMNLTEKELTAMTLP